MKRSTINQAIEDARALLKKAQIQLPEFGYWDLESWQNHRNAIDWIAKLMLGWDVTDFNENNFYKQGGVLFTLRNGDPANLSIGVPYAEKYIILKEGQALPCHFHHIKTEDIINRYGGILALELYNAKPNNEIDYETPVSVRQDGILHTYKPGEQISVKPGGSITLTPRLYHRFWALKGAGDLVVGEVSSVNDDYVDNYFNPPLSRFSAIEEDEPKETFLCNEYDW